ncbi:hypothetical protein [Paludisphaera sp.]|uniref:hypothetical protein n=1 Tax=Paludisphaera sp. TaxID=2017432 RepID=UPI00301DA354
MSRQPPGTTTPEILALPRPNPGPEPWGDDAGGAGWLVVSLAAVAIVVAALGWRRRRRVAPPGPLRVADDAPPEDRLLGLCDRLRADLAARLGPALRARTTEELAVDPRVAELFGDDLSRLVDILTEGDRLKFARRPAVDLAERLPGWTAWAATRR